MTDFHDLPKDLQPWTLTLTGPNALIFELGEALGFDEITDALSVSIFEAETTAAGDSPLSTAQALYADQAQAKAALRALALPNGVSAQIGQLPKTDWVSRSQEGLPPVKAGRFWVYGSHDAKIDVPEDIQHPLRIEAGLAFGTGHHGTTKGCLLIFEDLLNGGFSPKSVLDLGCGAGTLAIASALALPKSTPILATDIDQDAADVTAANAQINGVADQIFAARADGFQSPIFKGRNFDLIFANILAGPLMGLAPDIARAAASGGHIILSGIIDDMATEVTRAFELEGLSVRAQPSIEGWTSLRADKP
jgi:ribosomal protein L11 methyltransferase